MFKGFAKSFCIILALQGICTVIVHAGTTPIYRGVNLSGAEFGRCNNTAKYGTQYIYPSNQIIDWFLAQGMNTFRLPFCWERLQPTAKGALDTAELGRLDNVVRYATGKGAYIILDPHNYASYWGKKLGDENDYAALADLWQKLAAQYKSNDHVIFGLMNEPSGIAGEKWVAAANASIAAIRQQQAGNLILVPGVAWTGAHSWGSTSYGTPNAVSMLTIKDPGNNYIFEMHQYLDSDSSGTHAECVDPTIGSRRMQKATDWLRQNNKKALLGEFAGAKNDVCYQAVDDLLNFITQNSDIWIGWTYWSAGAWLGNYMYALPVAATSAPSQLDILKKYLGAATCGSAANPCPPPNPPGGLQTTPGF